MLKVFKKVFSITPIAATYVFLYHILSGVFVAAKLYFTMNIIETGYMYIAKAGDIYEVKKYGILFLILVLVTRIMEYFYAIAMNGYLYEKTDNVLRYELGKKLSNVKLIKYEDRDFLTNLQRAEEAVDDERISTCIHHVARAVGQILGVALIISTLLSYSVYLVGLGILTVVPYFITRIIRGKAFYDLKFIQGYDARKLDYFYSLFTNTKSNREIKINDSKDFFVNKYLDIFKNTSRDYFNERLKDSRSLLFCDILSVIMYSLAIVITIKLAIDGKILIGMMGAALVAYSDMQSTTKEMIVCIGYLPKNFSFARDYLRFMSTDEDERAFDVPFGDVLVRDVSFNYPNTDNGIKNINVDIKSGESVAIVGYNGSGKTTFTKVLTGIYEENGEIYFADAINKNGIKLSELSIVPQDRSVTNLTIGEHVAASDVYDESRVKSALDYVGLGYIYEEHSLNTRIGKEFDGVELSGGERERLDIARAIYKDAKLLVLDEPTSALDPMEESRILKKFLEISNGRTSIIVTHRLGICKFVDKIIVMADGMVSGVGTHDELMAKNALYSEMYNAQSKFYD